MTPDELRELLRLPESERLEFKRNVPREPRRIAEAAAAFANTAGGTIVVGYDDQTGAPVGLSDAARDVSRVDEALRLVHPSLGVRPQRVDLDGKSFVVVEVPQGSQFPYRAGGRVVQRSGERVTAMTSDLAVRRAEAAPNPTAEERNLAEAIAEQSQLIERLTQASGWRRQLPLQLTFLAVGTLLGYVLGGWNPFRFG